MHFAALPAQRAGARSPVPSARGTGMGAEAHGPHRSAVAVMNATQSRTPTLASLPAGHTLGSVTRPHARRMTCPDLAGRGLGPGTPPRREGTHAGLTVSTPSYPEHFSLGPALRCLLCYNKL